MTDRQLLEALGYPWPADVADLSSGTENPDVEARANHPSFRLYVRGLVSSPPEVQREYWLRRRESAGDGEVGLDASAAALALRQMRQAGGQTLHGRRIARADSAEYQQVVRRSGVGTARPNWL